MENIESASQSVGVDTSVDNATQPHSSDEVCDQEDKQSTEKSEGEEVVPSDAEAAVSAVSTEKKIAADSAKNPKLTCARGGPLTNPGIVVTRADRPSAISRARQTKYDQLKERYWQKSKVTKQVMDLMTQYLNEDPPIYKRVKAQKLVLQDMMPDLSNLIDEVRNMAPCPEIEEDFPVLSDCVDNLLSQYRMHYPKASSSAVSSELTSSVVSSVHSRRTVDVALDIVQRKEAVAAEGQAKVEEVENVIEVLQQRIKQEDMQRRKAEEDVDKAERDVDAHVRQKKEEAERRREEAEKEANRKKEDADREASKKKEKARLQLKEEREQREQRKEELEAMIAERRKQKENIVKEYKEKETRVVMETIAGQLEVESKPPDLPNLSMVEAYVNPNVLTPLKQNLVGQALSKNQVGRPAPMMTTRLHQGLSTADRQPLYGAAADGGLYTYINEATSTRQHAVGRRRPMTERHPEGWRTSAGHLLASTDHHSGRDCFPLWYSPYTTAVEAVGTTTMTTTTTTMAATVTSAAVTGERNTQGPDLLNSLVGVLCRFRKGKTAFSCDIQQMYHQFHVSEPHRDYLRFLWWDGGNLDGQLEDYRMKVHIFGATSSPGCANYGLKQVATDFAHVSPEASQFLKNDFYVDDGLHADDELESAVKTLKGAMTICEKGNMRLHKVISNSPELLSHFPESERSEIKRQDLGGATSPVERTLGLQWSTEEDFFMYSQDVRVKPVTRRGMLSTIASLYDPLGFIAPILLKGRELLQKVCRSKADWDDPLSRDMEQEWKKWTEELSFLREIEIPRSFVSSDFGRTSTVELHHFSDASEIGYGQCSYLRLSDDRGKVHCSLVLAKGRVAPLKTVTIPRLELQAATLSVRTAEFLEHQLAYEKMQHFFWTDSQIVLAYLANSQKKFPVFVANRISQILSFSTVEQWAHVTTAVNPADLVSRGKGVKELKSSAWYKGPDFLWEKELPLRKLLTEGPNDKELGASEIDIISTDNVSVMAAAANSVVKSMEDRFRRFSSLKSLLRAVGFILRFWAQRRQKSMTIVESWTLARERIVALAQREFLSSPPPSVVNTLKQLGCRVNDRGLIVVEGRLSRSRDDSTAQPVLLPRESHVTTLIAEECHQKTGHSGRTTTIHAIREHGYWIIGIRRVVSRVIGNCVRCRRFYAPPATQKMADLPEDRVTEYPPFLYCGADCFGPFYVKDDRKTMKRYALMVTCLASRAVHIEVIEDMSTDAFLEALRRVIAIRGQIKQIRCDRGTNFVGASRELEKAWKEMDVDSVKAALLRRYQCEWIFNPPAASHMGGVWERMIRSARRILNGLMTKAESRLTSSSLRTLLYEVMAIMNSRPLSVESLEDPSGPLPLTPNHILTTKSSGILPPPGVFQEPDLYLRRQWRKVQFLADQFWEKWRHDYLASLQYRRKWQQQQSNLAIGDVVVLREDNICRADWRLALVIDVYPSEDGLVRRCLLRVSRPSLGSSVAEDQGQMTKLERHVNKVVLLFSPGDVLATK